jgi:hypothetical protein
VRHPTLHGTQTLVRCLRGHLAGRCKKWPIRPHNRSRHGWLNPITGSMHTPACKGALRTAGTTHNQLHGLMPHAATRLHKTVALQGPLLALIWLYLCVLRPLPHHLLQLAAAFAAALMCLLARLTRCMPQHLLVLPMWRMANHGAITCGASAPHPQPNPLSVLPKGCAGMCLYSHTPVPSSHAQSHPVNPHTSSTHCSFCAAAPLQLHGLQQQLLQSQGAHPDRHGTCFLTGQTPSKRDAALT